MKGFLEAGVVAAGILTFLAGAITSTAAMFGALIGDLPVWAGIVGAIGELAWVTVLVWLLIGPSRE